MFKKTGVALVATVLVGLVLAGCSGPAATSPSSTAAKPSTDTIHTVTLADPTSLEPAKGASTDDYLFARLLYDTVVRRDADNKIVGGLATSWDVKPSSASFTIRKDATCADGTPITASIVANSLKVFADPATKSAFTALVFGPGAPTISSSGDKVNITLAQPWSELLVGLTLGQTGIMCPAGLANVPGMQAGTVPGAFSGPYTLGSVQRGQNYELTLRKGYNQWPKFAKPIAGTPAKTIDIAINSNSTTIANQLLTNAVDIAPVASSELPRFQGNKSYDATSVALGSAMIMFNERPSSVFTDPAMRKAVAQALDAKAFNAATSNGTGTLLNSVAPPGTACVVSSDKYLTKTDLAAAKKELTGKKIHIVGSVGIGPNGAGNVYVAEALRAAGADVQLDNVDNATWSSRVNTQQNTWDFTVLTDVNQLGTIANPLTRIVGIPTEKGGRSVGDSQNTEALADLTKAMDATSDSARCDAFKASQISILKNNDVAPLATLQNTIVARSGFAVTAESGIFDYSTMRIVG